MFGWAEARDRKDGTPRRIVMQELDYPPMHTDDDLQDDHDQWLNTNDQLVEALMSMGVFRSGDFGLHALEFENVMSWAEGTATPLSPWDTEALVAASRSAVASYQRSDEKHEVLAPYGEHNRTEMRARSNDQARIAFKAMAGRRNKKGTQ